jgi:hypothetical protein
LLVRGFAQAFALEVAVGFLTSASEPERDQLDVQAGKGHARLLLRFCQGIRWMSVIESASQVVRWGVQRSTRLPPALRVMI